MLRTCFKCLLISASLYKSHSCARIFPSYFSHHSLFSMFLYIFFFLLLLYIFSTRLLRLSAVNSWGYWLPSGPLEWFCLFVLANHVAARPSARTYQLDTHACAKKHSAMHKHTLQHFKDRISEQQACRHYTALLPSSCPLLLPNVFECIVRVILSVCVHLCVVALYLSSSLPPPSHCSLFQLHYSCTHSQWELRGTAECNNALLLPGHLSGGFFCVQVFLIFPLPHIFQTSRENRLMLTLCVSRCLFGWMKCCTVHGCALALAFHCTSLLLSCQFSLVRRLSLPQPFGCVLPAISDFLELRGGGEAGRKDAAWIECFAEKGLDSWC